MNFEKIIESSIPIKEYIKYCYDNAVDINEVAEIIEKETGLVVISRDVKTPVNGFLVSSYISKENIGTAWCGKTCGKGEEHTCVVLCLYAENKPQRTEVMDYDKRKPINKVLPEIKVKEVEEGKRFFLDRSLKLYRAEIKGRDISYTKDSMDLKKGKINGSR